MAKRKRITPPDIQNRDPMPGAHSPGKAAETGPMRSMTRAPIAQVAGDAAAQAALDHLSREFDEARQDGRMALSLALAQYMKQQIEICNTLTLIWSTNRECRKKRRK